MSSAHDLTRSASGTSVKWLVLPALRSLSIDAGTIYAEDVASARF